MTDIAPQIAVARIRLREPETPGASTASLMGAAALAAVSALLMAGIMVLGPGVALDRAAPAAVVR